jgi:DNA-binding transcriptional ArsR family regulator
MLPRFLDADARILRAAAHPLRAAIAYELFARGESTATEIAGAVDAPVNSVSFHLRELARFGLVEEAPGEHGDRRQRWWRMTTTEGLRVDRRHIQQEPGGKAALRVRRRHMSAWWSALIERFFGSDHSDDPLVWRQNDVPMLLTAPEADEMADEVYAVLRRWAEYGQGQAAAERGRRRSTVAPSRNEADYPHERRTYLVLTLVMPHQTDLVER